MKNEQQYEIYKDRIKPSNRTIINELHSPYYLTVLQGHLAKSAEQLLVSIAIDFAKASIMAEFSCNEMLKRIPIVNWEDTRKKKAEEITVDQINLFNFLAKVELLHSGRLPLHSYGNIEGNNANSVGMRYFSSEEKENLGKLDWLTIFINSSEKNSSNFKRVADLKAFTPILLHETYESLVRNKFSSRDALRTVFTAFSPIQYKDNSQIYESKITSLKLMRELLIEDSEAIQDFDEIFAMYSNSEDFFIF